MADNGVTHKDLNAALGRQTAIIIATVRRTEDNLKEDTKAVSDRVTYLERRSRTEIVFADIISSVVTFFGVILYGKFTGGSG